MRYMVVTTPNSSTCELLLEIVDREQLHEHVGFTSFNSDLGASLLERYPDSGIGVVIDTVEKRVLNTRGTAEMFKNLVSLKNL